MIRFGKFDLPGTAKPASQPYRRIFPIPQATLDASKDFTQNPGYQFSSYKQLFLQTKSEGTFLFAFVIYQQERASARLQKSINQSGFSQNLKKI